MKTRTWLLFLALVLGLSITSCSSGGGGDEDPADTEEDPLPAAQDLAGWNFVVQSDATASIAVAGGVATITVKNGGDDESDVQLANDEPLSLIDGKLYKISLTVTGTADHSMSFTVNPASDDRLCGQWSQICCDGTAQTISRVVKGSSGNTTIKINFGSLGDNEIDNSNTVYEIENVKVELLGDAPALSGSELLLNGDFSFGSYNWQTYYALNRGANADISYDAQRIDLKVKDDGDLHWTAHVRTLSWITLEAGKTYKLSFSCKGDNGKALTTMVMEEGVDGDGDGTYSIFFSRISFMNGGAQNISGTFTVPKKNNRIVIKFNGGYDDTNHISNDDSSFSIDDISLTPVD